MDEREEEWAQSSSIKSRSINRGFSRVFFAIPGRNKKKAINLRFQGKLMDYELSIFFKNKAWNVFLQTRITPINSKTIWACS